MYINYEMTQVDGTLSAMAGDEAIVGPPETLIKLADPSEATYIGRVRKTFHMLDVRTAFTTKQALHGA
ncbi:hypothetical protein PsorP6_005699 [Peronosclerospora sorghi]|uniref:Uncharacterized protein n=1 Tax=Peronosclerospora sorghi TaxID=230839 RepID=A0ACC0W4F6_9STRA|nr:hypothetical protein PsorP6_005699 [Peronosclerospora sorghi]